MWGWYTPTLFSRYTPPFVPVPERLSGSKYHEKHPGFGLSNRIGKPCCPVGRIVVNRDPFRKLRFGKLL